jgi:3-phenylpropionate/trans-cinnamate dioxygenase ferredoxin subunit
MATTRVASSDDLPEGGTLRVTVGDRLVALVRCGGTAYALGDTCTHAEASLSEGDVDCDEGTVECPLHGSAFRLSDGEALTLPATRAARTYEVSERDGELHISVDEEPAG